MSRGAKGFRYPKFLALVLGVTAVLIAVGWWPTLRLAGRSGVAAMLAGCAISAVASLVGAIPLALAGAGGQPLNRLLGGMSMRFLVALVAGVGAALTGWWAVAPLIVWLALSYLVLLGVDTAYALKAVRSGRAQGSGTAEE